MVIVDPKPREEACMLNKLENTVLIKSNDYSHRHHLYVFEYS